MPNQSDAYTQYREITELFYSRQYLLFEERCAAFKTSPAYDQLEIEQQFDLDYHLAMCSYRQNQFEAALAGLAALKQTDEDALLSSSQEVKVLTLQAEILMKQEKYEAAQQLFEEAVSLAEDIYVYDDAAFRWEQSLDELELKYRKPTFIEQMKDRWVRLRALIERT